MSVKYSTFSAANHPNPIQRRLTEIGYHCQARVKPPMQCQCANPGRIRCQSRAHFGLATFRQSMAHRGRSCAIPIPILYQSRLRPKHCMLSIQYQSATNQLPIPCQCQATSQCSGVTPLPIHRQSSANPLSFDANPMSIKLQSSANPFQSDANPMSIQCQSSANPFQSGANPMSTQCQSNADLLSIKSQSGANLLPIRCQFGANPSPIHPNLTPISCQCDVDLLSIKRQSSANPLTIKHRPVPV